MPERSSKRKARRDSPLNSLDEPESSSMRTENAASLSDKDFTKLSEKIEKSVSKRIKDAEVGQREILKMIENLTSKIDTLTERPPNNVRHGPDDEDAENADFRYRLVEPSDLLPNHGQHNNQILFAFSLVGICNVFPGFPPIQKQVNHTLPSYSPYDSRLIILWTNMVQSMIRHVP